MQILFTLVGEPGRAKATVAQALEGRGFRMTWNDDWTAIAERGSKVGNVLAGAMAQYFKVGVQIRSAPEEQTVVVLDQLSSGWAGGAIGASRTKKNLRRLGEELTQSFQDAGMLVNKSEV
jgi:hypothetical protein